MALSTLWWLLCFLCHTVTCLPADAVDENRLTRRMQSDAEDVLPKRPLEWRQINLIHTTDLHGWYEGHMKERNDRADWGDFISFVQRMREKAQKLKVDLLVVDTGDLHDGAGLSDVTKPDGLATDEIFKMTGFDLLTVGNHEVVDAGLPNATHMNLAKHFGDRYITSNVYVNDTSTIKTVLTPIGSQSYYFKTTNGIRIMAFGVMFDMNPAARDTEIHLAKDMIEEDWFKSAVKHEDIDLFVLIGHNPARLDETDHDNNSTLRFVTDSIQKSRPGIPVQVFGGHSHTRDFMVYNEDATAMQAGRYAGVPNPSRHAKVVDPPVAAQAVNINSQAVESDLKYARRYLDFNRETFQFHTGTAGHAENFDTPDGLKVTKKITELRENYNLNEYYGCAPRSYCISCRPHNDEGNIYNLVEKALEQIVISSSRNNTSRLVCTNRNGIRYDLAQGPFTRDDSFIVCPFNDNFRFIPDVPADQASRIFAILGEKCPHGQDENNDLGSHTLESTSGQKVLFRRGIDAVGMMTPGYRTEDDFGTDGDDTQHSLIPHYEPPAYVQANITVHDSEGKLPETYDLVYIKHLEKRVLDALKCFNKTRTYEAGDYADSQINTNTLLQMYAQKFWDTPRESCTVGGSIG